jgi:low affinity Fe/Cu permease
MSGHKRSQKEEIPDAGMKHAVFLNNLEGWIDEIISQDGLADKELIRTIKERYERSIQANIDHYNYLAKNDMDRKSATS